MKGPTYRLHGTGIKVEISCEMGILQSLPMASGSKQEDEAKTPISDQNKIHRYFSTFFQTSRNMACCTLKGILRKICAVYVSFYNCVKGVLQGIKTVFYLSITRKADVPPLPLAEQTLLIPDSDEELLGKKCNLEQGNECPNSKAKDVIDFVTISLPECSDLNALRDVSTTSSSHETGSDVVIQENLVTENKEHDEETVLSVSTGVKRKLSCEEKQSCKDKECSDLNALRDDSTTSSSHETGSDAVIQENLVTQKKEYHEETVTSDVVVVETARLIKHYSSLHRILLVGEGDFSFSYSLAAAFGCASKMVATSLDSKAFLKRNYSMAPWNINELKKMGCTIMHGIDATTMATHAVLQHMKFDRIIYNFPFAGFFKGLSRDSTLRRHRRLVSLFLKNAKEMVNEDGEIHISVKTNGQHYEWKLVSIASSHGLRLIEEVPFNLLDFPGYNTKRGFGGDENFNCDPSSTFKFGLKN